MDARIEKTISNIVEYQFPQFYRSEGQTFIQFVKAYYEWMEESGNLMNRSRNILEYRDIDDTLESFLYFYQKKYLYGIPFDVIINKRYLLKHVLDVYRSKGSIQAYKLLFKLIYDEEIDVYIPGRDILRVSDGTWHDPRYLEVSNVDNLNDLLGKTITGLSSGTTAIVEKFVTEPINQNVLALLYISNILPKHSTFLKGEKIVKQTDLTSANLSSIVAIAPTIIGSLDSIEILNGGRDFSVGDLIKIARKDPDTQAVISSGIDGVVRVTNTGLGRGTIKFTIIDGGTGISNTENDVFVYNNTLDTTGSGASFTIQNMTNFTEVEYNEDIIASYADVTLGSVAYDFPGDPVANVSSTLQSTFTFLTKYFGTIVSLGSIRTGNSYTHNPEVFVRSTHSSVALPGTISYDTTSANITGTSTEFTRFFTNGAVIEIQANTSDSNTAEKHIIRSVTNNTVLTLMGAPSINSTASATFKVSPNILVSDLAPSNSLIYRIDGKTTGEDANIAASLSLGNNVILTTSAIDSGKGYVDGETVKLYLYGAVDIPTIVSGGTGYTNNEILVFAGGTPSALANGYVTTDANGTITTVNLTYGGSGYTSTPTITVKSANGTGASLTTEIIEFNTLYEVTGRVVKGGVGRKRGDWNTTRGFLNSDKYIQDSYFYQDFSYQIKAATALSTYRDILYNTFHIAGTELFGQYLVIDIIEAPTDILYEQTTATIT